MEKIILLTVVFFSLFCHADSEPVSMVNLLSDPSSFEGKKISVYGYVKPFGSPVIFLTKNHAKGYDYLSAVGVEDRSKNGLRNYPGLEGWRYVEGDFSETKVKGVYKIINVETIKDGDGKVFWSKGN